MDDPLDADDLGTTGVGPSDTDDESSDSHGDDSSDGEYPFDNDEYSLSDEETTESQRFEEAEARGRAAAAGGHAVPRRNRTPNRDDIYDYIHTMFDGVTPDVVLTLLANDPNDDAISLLTAQMSAKAGLKQFGEAGAAAITKELEQLVYRKVLEAKKAHTLSREQKKAALRYLMFLKMKRSGKIKGRGCADGRKQRIYKTKEETSSPTISTEALFLTCMINALEG